MNKTDIVFKTEKNCVHFLIQRCQIGGFLHQLCIIGTNIASVNIYFVHAHVEITKVELQPTLL